MALKPIVDGLEEEYRDRLIVIRLNIQEGAGHDLATVYGFLYTPTFIFFDSQGNEVWRQIGGLDKDPLRQALMP